MPVIERSSPSRAKSVPISQPYQFTRGDVFDDGVDYRKDGVWKVLKDVPKLEISPGESWERSLQLSVWKAEFLAIAHAVGRRWSLFLEERFQLAEVAYEQIQVGKLSTYEYLDETLKLLLGVLVSIFVNLRADAALS